MNYKKKIQALHSNNFGTNSLDVILYEASRKKKNTCKLIFFSKYTGHLPMCNVKSTWKLHLSVHVNHKRAINVRKKHVALEMSWRNRKKMSLLPHFP